MDHTCSLHCTAPAGAAGTGPTRHALSSGLGHRMLAALASSWLLFADPVGAQTLPSGADASRLGERFSEPAAPLAKPGATTISAQMQGETAPEGAAEIRLVLTAVTVEGSTVFSEEQLAAVYAAELGEEISLQTVYDIAGRITALYGNAGYLLSRAIVPPQTIDGGAIRLQVIEGFIDEVLFEDLPERQPELFNHYRERIRAARPISSRVLERYLMLANDLPGMKFKAVLRASRSTPGASTLILKASEDDWDGSLSLDNRGTESSGPWQTILAGNLYGASGRFDRTSLQFAVVPDDLAELRYARIEHLQTLNGEGLKLSAYLSASSTEPGDEILRALETDSESRSIGATLAYPWIRSRAENLSVQGSIEQLESTTKQFDGPLSDDRLYPLSLGVSYDRSDTWGGGGVNLLSLTLFKGLDVFGAKSSSRAAAQPAFGYLAAQARRDQVLGAGVTATLRLSAQMADGALPSSQQFGLGGEYSVRGYDPSEWTGDDGLSGSLEVAYRTPLGESVEGQFYGFADAGKVWRDAIQPGERRSDEARSLGLGLRAYLPRQVTLSLEGARQLDDDSLGNSPEWQGYFKASLGF